MDMEDLVGTERRTAEMGANSAEMGAKSAEMGTRSAEMGARSAEMGARSAEPMRLDELPSVAAASGASVRVMGVLTKVRLRDGWCMRDG